MVAPDVPLDRNALLRGLAGDDLAAVRRDGSVVHLALRETVQETNAEIRWVHFPLEGVISVVSRMLDGASVEIGVIGHEGMTGLPLMFGRTTSTNASFCQVRGDAWRMSAAMFGRLRLRNDGFRTVLDRFCAAYVEGMGQFTACNRLHGIAQRAARWILMTQDRVPEGDFPLTHEFLATMLGCRRSGVTIAAAGLQSAGYIDYRRGRVTVRDRAGLESVACECYETATGRLGDLLDRSAFARRPAGK